MLSDDPIGVLNILQRRTFLDKPLEHIFHTAHTHDITD